MPKIEIRSTDIFLSKFVILIKETPNNFTFTHKKFTYMTLAEDDLNCILIDSDFRKTDLPLDEIKKSENIHLVLSSNRITDFTCEDFDYLISLFDDNANVYLYVLIEDIPNCRYLVNFFPEYFI